MFGHQQEQDTTLPSPAPDGNLANDQTTTAPPVTDTAGEFLDDVPAPTAPQRITQPNTSADDLTSDDFTDSPSPVSPSSDTGNPDTSAAPTTPPNNDQLLNIKQQALQQLTPLLGHLEQDPEEKFRTTMMMIQAADNHELIQEAYQAAQAIQDDKVRAQALLDIVNEINYFTHNKSQAV